MFGGISIDFSIYSFEQTIIIIGIVLTVFVFTIHKLTKFLNNRTLTIKDFITIGLDNAQAPEKKKESFFKKIFKKIFKKKDGKSGVIVLNKDKAEEVFAEIGKILTKEVKEVEREKYHSVLSFGVTLENCISKVIKRYTDLYEASLLECKRNVQSIEDDMELLIDYKNFVGIMKDANKEINAEISSTFQSKIESCVKAEDKNCFDEDAKEFAKLIIFNVKKNIRRRVGSGFILIESYIKDISKIDNILHEEISAELQESIMPINKSMKKTIEKVGSVKEEIESIIENLYEQQKKSGPDTNSKR